MIGRPLGSICRSNFTGSIMKDGPGGRNWTRSDSAEGDPGRVSAGRPGPSRNYPIGEYNYDTIAHVRLARRYPSEVASAAPVGQPLTWDGMNGLKRWLGGLIREREFSSIWLLARLRANG